MSRYWIYNSKIWTKIYICGGIDHSRIFLHNPKALQQIAIGIGSAIGPIVGSCLNDIGGFFLPFVSFGIAMIFAAPFNLYFISLAEKNIYRTKLRTTKTGKICGLFNLVCVPEVSITMLVVIINGSSFGFLNPTLELAVNESLKLSPSKIAFLFPILGGSYAIMCFVWSRIVTQVGKGEECFMMIGITMCAIIFLLLGPSPIFVNLDMKLWLLITLLTYLGCFLSMNLVPTLEFMKSGAVKSGRYVDNLETYGFISGIWSSCMSLGETIGPAYGGILMERYGFPIVCSLQAILCLLTGIVLFIYVIAKSVNKKKIERNIIVCSADVEDENGESSL